MPMSQEAYYALNRAFDAVRTAEKEAAKLEQEAQALRDKARESVQAAYDLLNGKAKP